MMDQTRREAATSEASSAVLSDGELQQHAPDVNTLETNQITTDVASHHAKRLFEGVIYGLEVNPITNEIPRYGALFLSQLAFHGTVTRAVVGAAVLGGSTGLLEGGSAVATADLITSQEGNKVIDTANRTIAHMRRKLHLKEKKDEPEIDDDKLDMLIDVTRASIVGTPLLMTMKQLKHPEREKVEARRHGLRVAGWLAAIFTIEGAYAGPFIGNLYTTPSFASGGEFLGMAAVTYAGTALLDRVAEGRTKVAMESEA